MRILTLLSVLLLYSNLSISQAVAKSDFIINPYYGFPNLGKFGQSLLSSEGERVRGVGPWGLRMEFLLSDKIGVTAEGIHNSYGLDYTIDHSSWDQNGDLIIKTFDYKERWSRFRFQLGFNYHFDTGDAQTDVYLGLAAGTNNRFHSLDTAPDNPFISSFKEPDFALPFSMRARVGGSYYISDNFGLNLELGLGGPIVSGGMVFRLPSYRHYE